ncbi:MAG: biosynthetic-type acetolactate synthase large subunit, partial [Actinomycetia bacterium]|nr:biosynthetic-type acetolactate synthase large subunit [Actinomycetes bacterium]
MKINGAEALLRSLENEGVEIVFGIPGGVLLPIYEALYGHPKIKHILMRHEQSAAHAADGYARATGKVGVCIATSGPGATNLVTGIANAYMDSVPIVAITGQVSTPVLGTDAFQEADITGITLPIVKHSYLVKDSKDLPRIIKEAFHIASTGRPGPVLIDIPKDVATGEIDFKYPDQLHLPGYKPTVKGHAKQIKAAAKMIAESKKPIIYCGGGVISANASEELVELAEEAQIPVTTTLMGIGIIGGDDPLNLGMLGMHGTWYANNAITASDLIIALGVRFDDRVTGKLAEFAPNAKIIHADIDPAEIGKNVPARVPIVGSAKGVIEGLIVEVKKLAINGPVKHKAWLKQIAE